MLACLLACLLTPFKEEDVNSEYLGIPLNMPEDSVLSLKSIWAILAVTLAGAASSFLLVFAFYKLFRRFCPSLGISYRRQGYVTEDTETGGLPSDALHSIPTVRFREDEIKRVDCVICLTEFGEGELLRVLPGCLHSFHMHCIDTWLCAHSDCPTCRKQLRGESFSWGQMKIPLQALRREDFLCRERALDYYLLESEARRNEAIRSDRRGIQSLMWS